MAMLLRTRQTSFGLKVFCILTIFLTYTLIGIISKTLTNNNRPDIALQKLIIEGYELGKRGHFMHAINKKDSHWTGRRLQNVPTHDNCTPAALNEFPNDGLTREQRQNGWIIIHILICCYLFGLLAVVCDDYFVPAIKQFCDSLHIKEDIAGATLMAMASSSPELFINCVGTFVTQGDIGVGAIVGSAVFNVLAVPACCGLFANMVVDLDWWPISRDSMMYGMSVILLIAFLQDGKIYFYEALTLVSLYVVYILVMCFNTTLLNMINRLIGQCRRKGHYIEILHESTPLLNRDEKFNNVNDIFDTDVTLKDCQDLEESTNIWQWPSKQTTKQQIWWISTWPISFLLYITIPDCRKYPKLYVLTFIMCIFWIGMTTYIISWFITAVGDTLNIPDSVMGLTFLAAGMSVPEAVSSVIVTNQGHGSMGLSSSIGSNTFDILLCLGLPWLIKTASGFKKTGHNWIKINSAGLNLSAISLLSTIVMLYLSIVFNKFKLNWKVGITCLLMYVVFLTFASLIELNVFFVVNQPTCDR